MNLFIELAIIEFESGNIEHDEMYSIVKNIDSDIDVWNARLSVYNGGKLYKLWRFIYYCSPNYSTLDRILSKYLSGHNDIANFTFFGYNAMMWAIQYRGKRNYWLFRPPYFKILGRRGFSWGKLYCSPNGTSKHPDATIFYDFDSKLYRRKQFEN